MRGARVAESGSPPWLLAWVLGPWVRSPPFRQFSRGCILSSHTDTVPPQVTGGVTTFPLNMGIQPVGCLYELLLCETRQYQTGPADLQRPSPAPCSRVTRPYSAAEAVMLLYL
jgi:hypothetical protein